MRTVGAWTLGVVAGVVVVILAGCGADRPDRADTVQGPTSSVQEKDAGRETVALTQQQVESGAAPVE